MAISFLDNVTLGNNQLQNVVIQLLGSDPTGVTGKLIYNSTSNILKYYNGSGWISLTADTKLSTATASIIGGVKLFSDTDQSVTANAVTATASRTYGVQFNSSDQMVVNVPWVNTTFTEINFDASDGSSSQINDNGTMLFAQGTGITTTGDDSGTLTITNSKPFDSITLKATTGVDSIIANSGTVTIAAGAGITTTNDASGKVTIAATGSGSMSSFDLDGDSGATQTISDGDAVKIAGGTNITTAASATDTVTINLNDNITLAGDLTVTGGDITLGGTGRIQGVDTVTAATDAANKAYVDSSVAGGLTVKGGFNANTGVIVAGGNLTSGTERVAIQVGDYYIVTVAGNFFANAATPLTPGDSVLCQTAANIGNSVEPDFAVIQSDTDLATISTVGIGNVNINGAGNKDGLSLSYATGTATLGLDVSGLPQLTGSSLPIADGDSFVVYDTSAVANKRVLFSDIKAAVSSSFKGTSTSGTTHTFTHNLATSDVIVQLYNNAGGSSFGETVYASVDRTSTNVVTVTTAASANIRCLIQGL